MPTYDYECNSCGHEFEAFQRITEAPLGSCPRCGRSVRRLIGGGSGIIFKGSGFYTTDYKKSSTSVGNGGSKSKETAKEGASDSKPASGTKQADSVDTKAKDSKAKDTKAKV